MFHFAVSNANVPTTTAIATVLAVVCTTAVGGCDNGELGGGRSLIVPDAGEVVPDAGGAGISPFANATVGRSCLTGADEPYIVLSSSPAACDTHAAIIEGAVDNSAVALLPATTGTFTTNATVCLGASGCQTIPVTFVVNFWNEGINAGGTYALDLPGSGPIEGVFNAAWCAYDQFLNTPLALASGLAATDVKVLQGTTVTIASAGVPVAGNLRNAPVVESRPGLLRVFVEPLPTYTSRNIIARLTMQTPGVPAEVLEQSRRVTAASAENDLNTTFNFDLDAETMSSDLQWKVALHEGTACSTGDTALAQVPRDGSLTDMAAQTMGDVFNVVLVPVRYTADGSNRLPDMSPEQIALYRDLMYAQYPISNLNLTVRPAPLTYDQEILPRSDADWSEFLETIWALRDSDGVPPNTFYYGLVTPEESVFDFCGQGCIAGVGAVPPLNQDYFRGAVGLGYTGRNSAETFTHEIGHTTGREHSPCSDFGDIAQVDDNYPHEEARLGPFGYNILTETLFDPSVFRDIMSYCNPQWVSDYTYRNVFNRIRAVNSAPAFSGLSRQFVRIAISTANEVRWGRHRSIAVAMADPVAVTFEDAAGHVVATETADTIYLNDVEAVMYLVPDVSPEHAVQVRLPTGQTLAL